MAEREWREASDMRPSAVGLAAVLLCAALLRFWALGHGIPFAVQVDEPEIVARAVTMMKTGDFNPHFFDYPGLYIYVQTAVSVLRFLDGAMGGEWQSLDQVSADDFYLWGRAVTAAFGVATVLIVYLAGLRWGARHALLAAGLLAVMPMHVRESHYVLTDVPMTFFATLTFLLALQAGERGTIAAFVLAGAAAGLAAATKYNGLLALLLPLLAAWLARGRPRVTLALASVGGAAVAFLLAAPYTVLDLPGFLNAFGNLASHYAPRPRAGEPGWLIYLKHLRNGLQWPALILTFCGLSLGLVRAWTGPGHLRWLLAVSFPLLYFAMLSRAYLIYGRYLLPILPFACLLAAIAVVSGVSLLRRFDIPRAARTALIAALTISALLPPARESVAFDRRIGRVSTQQLAYEWIMQHVPEGSRVGLETRGLLLPARKYRVEYFPRLMVHELEDFTARGYQYIVASSQSFGPIFDAPERHADAYAAYRLLFDRMEELKRIPASDEHPGPEFRVFRVPPAQPAPEPKGP